MIEELKEVQERVHEYHDSLKEAANFAVEREIEDNRLILYFMMMGVVWTASARGEELTLADVEVFLNQNLEAAFDKQYIDSINFPSLKGLASVPLIEFLDYIHQSYFE